MTWKATRVIAVSVREEHVVDRQRGQWALPHVETHGELRNLHVRRESRDRESGDGQMLELKRDLLERIVVLHGWLFMAATISTTFAARPTGSAKLRISMFAGFDWRLRFGKSRECIAFNESRGSQPRSPALPARVAITARR